MWWIYEINRFRRLSHALVHVVMDRASLFTDHNISGRPILPKYKHFRTIWEHVFDNSPTDFCFFFFEVVVIDAWSGNFIKLLCRLVRQTHNIVPHISLHDPPCHNTMKKYEDFEGMVIFSTQAAENSNMVSVIVHSIFCLFRIFLWVHPKYPWSKKDVGSPKSTSLLVLSTSDQGCVFFPANFYITHMHR